MIDLQKKVALVTGGASGIGLACAKELLANGIKGVALVDINEEQGNKVVIELNGSFKTQNVIFIKADVSNMENLRNAFEKCLEIFGNLDIVLNNAGLMNEVNPMDCFKVNLIGVSNCAHLAMEEFLPKFKIDDGVIINSSSIVALEPRNWPTMPVYTTTKLAILGLTMTLGHEYHYKRTGVKVMAICPGTTNTAIITQFQPSRVTHFEEMIKMTALKATIQEASDVARHVVEILAIGKNGSIWKIDGGEKEEANIAALPYSKF